MVFGLLVGLLFLSWFENKILFMALVMFGSLLPDIDNKNARIHRYIPFTRWIQLVFEHRGVFHSLLIPSLSFLILSLFGYVEIGMAIVLGYSSHLVMDSLTPHGVFYFYPLHRFHVKGFVKVGGVVEKVIFIGMVGGLLLILIHLA